MKCFPLPGVIRHAVKTLRGWLKGLRGERQVIPDDLIDLVRENENDLPMEALLELAFLRLHTEGEIIGCDEEGRVLERAWLPWVAGPLPQSLRSAAIKVLRADRRNNERRSAGDLTSAMAEVRQLIREYPEPAWQGRRLGRSGEPFERTQPEAPTAYLLFRR